MCPPLGSIRRAVELLHVSCVCRQRVHAVRVQRIQRLDQRKVKRRLKNQAQAGESKSVRASEARAARPRLRCVALRLFAQAAAGRTVWGSHLTMCYHAVRFGPCPSLVLPQQPQARREDYWRRQNGDLAHLSSCSCAHAGYEGAVVVGGHACRQPAL
jgi:hypothetical protein